MTITFTDDQKVKFLKDASDLFFAAKQLHDWVKNDELKEDMAGILPNLIENHFLSISQALNYGSYLEKEHEKRFAEIRRANGRIRELEEQLAANKPIDGLREQLSGLYRTVYDWWKEEGFRHISEMDFTSSGSVRIEFSFMLDTCMDKFLNDEPVTNQKRKVNKIRQLMDRGFQLEQESENSYSWEVIDTTDNRKLLVEMLEERFPSIRIFKINSMARGHDNNEKFILRGVEAYITNLHDIPREEHGQ